MNKWIPMYIRVPPMAGRYLVASIVTGEVSEARYMPKKEQWKFPAAAMSFGVTHWMDKPEAPHE